MAYSRSKWEKVGTIGVDAGLCWIGDPCYVIHKEKGGYPELGKDWEGFCDKLEEKEQGGVTSFNGLGVAVQTGYGDGEYAVYVRRSRGGRVGAVKVVFIPKGE